MSYQLLIEKDRPACYNTFDSATNQSHPLVAGLGSSAVVTTTPFTHSFDAWGQRPFTVEVWFKPLSASRLTIVGHDDDGLVYENGLIKVIAQGRDGNTYEASLPATSKVMYLVYQYTGYSIDLAIDGIKVSTPMTAPMKFTGNLKSGGGRMSIDALAIYPYLLTDEQLSSHYYSGIDFPPAEVMYVDAENYFPLTEDREDTLVSRSYPSWEGGFFDGVSITSEGLSRITGSLNGQWQASILLPDDVALSGSSISWTFTGPAPVVESSVDDGNTWSPCNNRNAIAALPVGVELPGVDPLIRVTLPEGSLLESLDLAVYKSNLSTGVKDTRTARLTRPAVSAKEQFLIFEQDSGGGVFVNGGSVNIDPIDDGDINNVASISFWYLGPEIPGGTNNGGRGYYPNQWNFHVRNFDETDTTINVVTNYNGQIANVATWPVAQGAASLYNWQFAYQTISVREEYDIELFEPDRDVSVYQNNWIVL